MAALCRFPPAPLIVLLIIHSPAAGAEEPFRFTGGNRGIGFAEAADLAIGASEELRGEYAMKALRERGWVLGRRAYLPRFSLSASEDDRLAKISSDSFLKNYTIKADQLLWDGGRTSMNRKLERMELVLAGSKIERMAADIADSAAASYRNVLYARSVLEIREAALASLAEQRKILAQELALGLVLELDLAEADVALGEAETEVLSMRIDLRETERQFAELLGLEELPELAERIDTGRKTVLPPAAAVRAVMEYRNPELAQERLVIAQKQGELKYASLSWVPSLSLNGSFGLSGHRYPLTRQTWSVGIGIEFSSPWFQNSTAFSSGWEPPYDKTARLQNTFQPLPEPAKALTRAQAQLALSLERTRYDLALGRLGRNAAAAVEKCGLMDRKRTLALKAAELAAERYRISRVRQEIGQLTRLELMEERIEYARRETGAVEAAAALLEAERELERLLDLRPGELADFAVREFSSMRSSWSGS
ncbi:MAG: TolC family protein [Treponema sp.]|jgi:outer membrane protein TolC|nr:TolC family protein [Treponema sp.]